MEIRKVVWEDLGEVARLYDTVNDYLECHVNYPGWKKGIYPTEEDARNGIAENALFVAVEQGRIAGTFLLRHRPEAGYAQVNWNCELEENQVWVLYTFAVHPDFRHRGIGRGILGFLDRYAAETGAKAIRLDVSEKTARPLGCMKAWATDILTRLIWVTVRMALIGSACIRKSFELCHASAMAFRRRFPRENISPCQKGAAVVSCSQKTERST